MPNVKIRMVWYHRLYIEGDTMYAQLGQILAFTN